MTLENKNTYRNVIITSIITAILITSGIGVAYADDYSEEFNDPNTSATGHKSSAFGYSTLASGDRSVAFGLSTTASGINSAAFGGFTTADGINSAAFGNNNVADGTNSAAFGINNVANGTHSAVFGFNNVASGFSSVAFGIDNHASGIHSAAFGQETEARGEHSAAFGKSTLAEANHSVAFGGATIASGEESAAFGRFTNSSTNLSFVIGRNNEVPAGGNVFLWVATDPLFVIGNGGVTGSGETQTPGTPHNALTVLKNGNVGIGITSPNSQLEVTEYLELATSAGTPPSADCNAADELGRLKVAATTRNLYVCTYDGSTFAWLTL